MQAKTLDEQAVIFAGVKYDLMRNVAILPNGTVLDGKRFNVEFANGAYGLGNGSITYKAWVAFRNYAMIASRKFTPSNFTIGTNPNAIYSRDLFLGPER